MNLGYRIHFRLARVIPAKAGIQTISDKFVTRNQVRIAVNKYLLTYPPVIPAKAGIQTASDKPTTRNQVRITSDKSLII